MQQHLTFAKASSMPRSIPFATITLTSLLAALSLSMASCGRDPKPAPATAPADSSAAAPQTKADTDKDSKPMDPLAPDMRASSADGAAPARPASLPGKADVKPVNISEEEWKKKLSAEEFYILRQKGTERSFTGKYWKTKPAIEQAKDQSIYACGGCGLELFKANSKFDSGCGWPSFDRMLQQGVIKEIEDRSHGMIRTEVVCARCNGHLGHLFDDGPTDTGLRYCINSASIDKKDPAAEPKPEAKSESKPADQPKTP
jgi:peptide-methionine (R)-S-oxide reductase